MLEKYKSLLAKRIKKIIINSKITIKWYRDGLFLPLTKTHFELYKIIHLNSKKKLNKFPKLINCVGFNDKIQWLKLFDQDELIIQCSDKIAVREYIKDKVGEEYLIKLYQVQNNFSDIDFNRLPNSFVIKTNHDSGTVILVKDKSKIDLILTEKNIKKSLNRTFGWKTGEWAYAFIKPKILIEEYLNPYSDFPPADYKFYTVNGKVKFCHYIYDRGENPKEQIIGRDGVDLKISMYPTFKYGNGFIKPNQQIWEKLISVAESIGNGFKYVRVDLYLERESIYFGEMTFWPMNGCYKGKGQMKLGEFIDFDRKTYKNPIYNKLKYENSLSYK